MKSLYLKTMRRERILKEKGYRVLSVWECQWEKMKKEDTEIQDFLDELDIPSRLVMRDSFKGGRTNCTKLWYSVKPGEKVSYLDFTSLYPSKYAKI